MSLAVVLTIIVTSLHQSEGFVGIDVFHAQEDGYFCIKIPYLLTTQTGTILAMAEGRIGSCGDYETTHLVYKLSHDEGQTWGPLKVLHAEGNKTVIGNAAPVQDRTTGRIFIPFNRNNHDVLLVTSDDDCATWSNVTDLTSSVVEAGWKWVGLGPPAGIQLQSGRLLVPAYHDPFHWDDGTITHSHIIYSDDHGTTWQIGGKLSGSHLSNECQAVELANNTVMLNARGLLSHRLQAISTDGGLSFGPTTEIDLRQPFEGCEGSIVKQPTTGYLFFSHPNSYHTTFRTDMVVHWSRDNGTTWELYKTIDKGPAAYSALSVMPNGNVAMLYESATKLREVFQPEITSWLVIWAP